MTDILCRRDPHHPDVALDEGSTTAEYGTCGTAAVAFATVLWKLLTSHDAWDLMRSVVIFAFQWLF